MKLISTIPMILEDALSGLSSETRIRRSMTLMVVPLSNAVTQYWFPAEPTQGKKIVLICVVIIPKELMPLY